jgi:8-oxo-dGTP pyrophosphatase MutT (NUDIX family)
MQSKIGSLILKLGRPFFKVLLDGSQRSRVCVMVDHKMLVVKPFIGADKWALPGGGIHKNEAPAVAAVRELYEETKVQVAAEKLKEVGAFKIAHDSITYTAHCFLVEFALPPETKRQWLEVADLQWKDVRDLEFENISQEVRYMLDYLK